MNEPKKYKLSQDEVANIKGRRKFVDYIMDLVDRDVAMYMYTTVYQRLGIKDVKTELSEDGEWLIETPQIVKEVK